MKTSPGEVIVHVFGHSDVGRAREHNEDNFLVADLSSDRGSFDIPSTEHRVGERGVLFMVADGLGGAAAGELASELAVDTVVREMRQRLASRPSSNPDSFARALKAAAEAANSAIHTWAVQHPEQRGMGTTATIAGALGDTLYLAQVGDSRAYLIRDGHAVQITKDQSLMQRLIDAGELTQEEAERSERRNIILQALGPEPAVKVDITRQPLRRGDILVLCTDGLSGLVSGDEIAEMVKAASEPMAACADLIARANENGGPDNITAIVARFDGPGLETVQKSDNVGYTTFAPYGVPTPADASPAVEKRTTGPMPVVGGGGGPRSASASESQVLGDVGDVGGGHSSHSILYAILATLLLVGLYLAARQLGTS